MRILITAVALAAACALASTAALAQGGETEVDRLRDALRSATMQARALEDQRTALQAKITQVERDNGSLKEQLSSAKARIKQVEKDYREAVTQFNERLEERNQTLEKWKEAYGEAATVARAKDAERAKFEAEAAATKASLTTCTTKNQELVKVGRELLAHYDSITLGDAILAQEPLTGIRRTQVLNVLQDYGDKVQAGTVPVERKQSNKAQRRVETAR